MIYLERQNAAGTGFHVVQVGHVLPGSTYSIVHQVYVRARRSTGSRFPADRTTGARSASCSRSQVTPAPASALTPEAPGNSSSPSEGQTTGSEAETPLSE